MPSASDPAAGELLTGSTLWSPSPVPRVLWPVVILILLSSIGACAVFAVVLLLSSNFPY